MVTRELRVLQEQLEERGVQEAPGALVTQVEREALGPQEVQAQREGQVAPVPPAAPGEREEVVVLAAREAREAGPVTTFCTQTPQLRVATPLLVSPTLTS
jgi:hypothetical protein